MKRQNIEILRGHFDEINEIPNCRERRHALQNLRDYIQRVINDRALDHIKAKQFCGGAVGGALGGSGGYIVSSLAMNAVGVDAGLCYSLVTGSATLFGGYHGAKEGVKTAHDVFRGCPSEELIELRNDVDRRIHILTEQLRAQDQDRVAEDGNHAQQLPPEQEPRRLQETVDEVRYALEQATRLLGQLQEEGTQLEDDEVQEILEDIDAAARGQIMLTLVEDPVLASDNRIYSREALAEWARVRGPEMRLPGGQRQLDMNIAELRIYEPARQVYFLVEQINALRQANAVSPNPQPQ